MEALVFASRGHDLPETWGTATERLRLGIDTEDADDLQLCIDYLPNGRVATGSVNVALEESSQFALAVLRLTATGLGCSTADLLTELLEAERRRH
jgi:hypothetical protein